MKRHFRNQLIVAIVREPKERERLVLILYAEALAAARTFAAKNKYDVAPNQELAALGAANIASGMFQGIVGGGGMSGTAANDAVLALWNGYDDDAAARLLRFLARNGRNILIVGPEKGALPGLNGSHAEVVASYDDRIRLSSSAVIVAPGGVWPKKTKAQQAEQPLWVAQREPARQKRLGWLIEQYQSGKMLVAVGFDSLYIGQQPLFKGKQFASTDQASVIWFGDKGAEYSPLKAMFSDRNLVTAKPLVGIGDAIALLQSRLNDK